MSDLSNFLPKNHLKTPAEDEMIKPISSLNIPKNDLPQNSTVGGGAGNLANNDLVANSASSDNKLAETNTAGEKNGGKATKKFQIKSASKKKNILLLLALLFLLVGSGAGLLLMRQRQDTRQEAYLISITPSPSPRTTQPPGGGGFCGPSAYGTYCEACRTRPGGCTEDERWYGNCVLIYCPNGNPTGQGCHENDPDAYWKFGTCTSLLSEARNNPEVPGCWQVDTVDKKNVYCHVMGCTSYEHDLSRCGKTTPTPPTVPPTAIPPTTIPPTRPPTPGVSTTVQPTVTPTVVPTRPPTPGVSTTVPPTVTPTTVPPTVTGTLAPTSTGTPAPTTEPTKDPTSVPSTPTPIITQVITTVGCNEACKENADCANISHICYEGFCRLDVNPTDVNCRLADGGNVIERAVTVPTESGFADWFNFIKVGFGILGLGALLLLLL